MSINAREKKRGRGRPPVDSEELRARMDRATIKAIDAAAKEQVDKPLRSEMLRRIAREWLTERGFLKSKHE